jgi:hypothetical protein
VKLVVVLMVSDWTGRTPANVMKVPLPKPLPKVTGVPAFGRPLGFQLIASSQLADAPPPSQVNCARTGGAESSRSSTSASTNLHTLFRPRVRDRCPHRGDMIPPVGRCRIP